MSKLRKVWNHWIRIAAMRLKDGDLLIVATAHDPDTAISDYAKRWAVLKLVAFVWSPLIFKIHSASLY